MKRMQLRLTFIVLSGLVFLPQELQAQVNSSMPMGNHQDMSPSCKPSGRPFGGTDGIWTYICAIAHIKSAGDGVKRKYLLKSNLDFENIRHGFSGLTLRGDFRGNNLMITNLAEPLFQNIVDSDFRDIIINGALINDEGGLLAKTISQSFIVRVNADVTIKITQDNVAHELGGLSGLATDTHFSASEVRTRIHSEGNINKPKMNAGGIIGSGLRNHYYDVHLRASTIQAHENVGGIEGSSENSSFKKVVVEDGTKIYSNWYSFGRVGGLYGSGSSLTIENCNISAILSGAFGVGGLIGIGQVDNVFNSRFSGQVISNLGIAGGLVGQLLPRTGVSVFENVHVENSTVMAMNEDPSHPGAQLGGFFGYQGAELLLKDSDIVNSTIDARKNVGGISGTQKNLNRDVVFENVRVDSTKVMGGSDSARHGGFVGHQIGRLEVSRSSVVGVEVKSHEMAGGAIGLIEYLSGADIHLNQILVTGKVTAISRYAGGLIGVSDNPLYATDVLVWNDVATLEYGATLVGLSESVLSVEQIYSNGSLSCSGTNCSALMNKSTGSVTLARSYWNNQHILQSNPLGGLGVTDSTMRSPEFFYHDWFDPGIWVQRNPGEYLTLSFYWQ